MKKYLSVVLGASFSAFLIVILAGSAAFAHESRAVAKYTVVVGFIVEPAIEGQKNGVDLRITNTETKLPVEGVEKTLKVEITHVPSNVSKTYDIRTIFRDPGHYTVDLILTEPGYYRFRFFGDIEGTAVNETFNSRSGGGNFNDVQPSGDLQFPVKVAEVREVEAVARHVEEENHEIQEQDALTRKLAIGGIALGAIGTLAAVVAVAGSRRRTN